MRMPRWCLISQKLLMFLKNLWTVSFTWVWIVLFSLVSLISERVFFPRIFYLLFGSHPKILWKQKKKMRVKYSLPYYLFVSIRCTYLYIFRRNGFEGENVVIYFSVLPLKRTAWIFPLSKTELRRNFYFATWNEKG